MSKSKVVRNAISLIKDKEQKIMDPALLKDLSPTKSVGLPPTISGAGGLGRLFVGGSPLKPGQTVSPTKQLKFCATLLSKLIQEEKHQKKRQKASRENLACMKSD